jgi:invasin-like protein/PASTA domain-containing protein
VTMRFTSAGGALVSGAARVLAVELRDALGNLTGAASAVTFTKTSGVGTVSGLGSKTSTAGIASVSVVGEVAGPITITAASGTLSASITFTVVPGSAAAAMTAIAASPASLPANGAAVSTISVHVRDAAGNAVTTSAGAISLRASAGRLSSVTDLHNGTYTASLTAGTTAGQAVVTGELDGEAIGSEATVTLEAQCLVPRVRGKTLAAAKVALRQAHCDVGRVKGVRSTTVSAGKVVSQNPGAGQILTPGSKVNLAVSRGRGG